MSGKNSFDQLATEILFEIFDYLSYNDIIYTFFHLNQRFNSILLQDHRFLNHFTTPIRHFSFWQTILPMISSRIEYFIITIPDFNFSLDLFPNLKSVIISSSLPIYYDQLTIILESKQFKKLTSLKIKGEIINKSGARELLSEKIFSNENSLHTYEYLPKLYQNSTDVDNLKISVNLHSLSLKVVDCKFLFQLLNYTPNLKYLNLLLLDFTDLNERSNSNTKFSSIKLEKISLVVDLGVISQRSFPFLTSFIKQFSSSLTYLSLNLNQIKTCKFEFDGFILQQQLLGSMIQLKSFHLYMQLEEEPIDVERFLSTFQTQFWLDHNWTFGLHETFLYTYLYTLPFHFDQLNNFIDFDKIKSNNSNIFNSLQTWSHVKSIEFSDFFKFSSNIIKQLKLKMPKLTSTTLTFQRMHNLPTNVDKTNQTDISLDSVTTVNCVGEYLQSGKYLLSHIFPNTRNLILSYSSESVANAYDEYIRVKWMTTDYIYSSKIEHVEIKLKSQDADCDYLYKVVKCLVKELLKMFINIQSFIFHFYDRLCHPSRCLVSELNKTIQLLNMEELAEIYQIKHIHTCLQFIRKQND